jgi:hypothetical protein
MTEDDIIAFATALLPGTVAVTAGEDTGAPEAAWGDTFFFYDPDDGGPEARKFPYATIVVHDYEGFDTASDLNREGVFRLNLWVGRELAGTYAGGQTDYTVTDRVIPHPVYAAQGWVSILNPGPATDEAARSLFAQAHAAAAERHRRRSS